MKNIKKKLIAIIALTTSGLLLGSLVYCGITAFPEVLQSDKELKKAQNDTFVPSNKETLIVPFETEEKENNPFNEVFISGAISDYISSSLNDGEVVYVGFADNSSKTKKSLESPAFDNATIRRETLTQEDSRFSIMETDYAETVVARKSEDNHNLDTKHISSSSSEITPVLTKTVKSKAKKQSTATHREIAECSLLVVGIINIISLVAIEHKKRKLLR